MRKSALVGGWLVVVALATTLTWQVVGAVDNQVNARPVSPLNVSAPQPAAAPTTSSTRAHTSATPSSPSTSMPASSSTTTTGSPTTTSTAPSTWQTESTVTPGGTVVVRYRPGEVVLETATPSAGFRAEIEKPGPPEVEVEFESSQLHVEIRISWEDGKLDIEVRESEES